MSKSDILRCNVTRVSSKLGPVTNLQRIYEPIKLSKGKLAERQTRGTFRTKTDFYRAKLSFAKVTIFLDILDLFWLVDTPL